MLREVAKHSIFLVDVLHHFVLISLAFNCDKSISLFVKGTVDFRTNAGTDDLFELKSIIGMG